MFTYPVFGLAHQAQLYSSGVDLSLCEVLVYSDAPNQRQPNSETVFLLFTTGTAVSSEYKVSHYVQQVKEAEVMM